MSFGIEEGEVCFRDGCAGIIELREVEDCSCHINPPCGICTKPRERCGVCDWQASDDHGILNDFMVKYDAAKEVVVDYKPRPLDPRKIDYRTKSHTHFSQICEGVYPEGTTAAQVEALVRGTFGGRFDSFGNGRFRYVAYTD